MGDDDPNGAYNRTLVFKGVKYVYWKENIYVHLISVYKIQCVEVTDEPFIPKGDGDIIKDPKDFTIDETKKASYELKVGNILSQL